jgi:hypothetical protein
VKPSIVLDREYAQRYPGGPSVPMTPWTWVLVAPDRTPICEDLGFVRDLTVKQAIAKAWKILYPGMHWIYMTENSVLIVDGKPDRLVIRNGEGLWNVYDISSGSAKDVALNIITGKAGAKYIAENSWRPMGS